MNRCGIDCPPHYRRSLPINRMYDDQIKADFAELYHALNGMPLQEMDWIINPVCPLCRDHERNGFVHGVLVGVRLAQEGKNDE